MQTKFPTLLAVLTVGALLLYALLAASVVKEEKTALLYGTNHSVLLSLATQLRGDVIHTSQQLKSHVLNQLNPRRGIRAQKSTLPSQMKRVAVFEKRSWGYKTIKLKFGVPLEIWPYDYEGLLDQAIDEKYAFRKLQSTVEGNQHILLANSFEVRDRNKKRRYVAVAEVEPDFFFKSLQASSLFTTFLIDRSGSVLFYVDSNRSLAPPDLSEHPLIKNIVLNNQRGTGTEAFSHLGKNWFGAYAPMGFDNLYIVSQTQEKPVAQFLAVFLKRTAIFAVGLFFLVLTIASIFYKRLGRDLGRLKKTIAEVGKENFNVQPSAFHTDEGKDLAVALERMASELNAANEYMKKCNIELEHQLDEQMVELNDTKLELEEVQEQQRRSTQLAAVRKVVGQTTQELVQPLTEIVRRLKQDIQERVSTKQSSPLEQLNSILDVWEVRAQSYGRVLDEDIKQLRSVYALLEADKNRMTANYKFFYEQAKEMSGAINKVRTLKRSTSVKEIVVLSDMIHSVLDSLEALASENKVSFLKEIHDTAVNISVNKYEMEQVLGNLVRNSIQAIESSGGRKGCIVIRTYQQDQEIWVDVIDDGIGIPTENQEKLFTHGFTTSKGEGTGLGLAMSRQYAKAFGGDVILVYSEPDVKGTCFRVSIPHEVQEAIPIKQAA